MKKFKPQYRKIDDDWCPSIEQKEEPFKFSTYRAEGLEIKPKERYYYNAIIQGMSGSVPIGMPFSPQKIHVPKEIHEKIIKSILG